MYIRARVAAPPVFPHVLILALSVGAGLRSPQNYIIDTLFVDTPHIRILGGFSGHGFEMGPLIGWITARLLIDGECTEYASELEYFQLPANKRAREATTAAAAAATAGKQTTPPPLLRSAL